MMLKKWSAGNTSCLPHRSTPYNASVNKGLSHNKALDVGSNGLCRDDFKSIGDDPSETRLHPSQWFESGDPNRPMELEIGSGKGTFLVHQALARPEVDHLGIEYARPFWLHAADRCRRHALSNARVVHEDARTLIQWYMADEVFDQAHIYFPDPWPKKRHHKRRLLNDQFLTELHRVLKADAIVRIVTDHDDYFEWIQEHGARVTTLYDVVPFTSVADGANEDEIVGTNFERKYRREGRPFHATAFQKHVGSE
jgi:tRNA (guanine-N7-)-methyltransferase